MTQHDVDAVAFPRLDEAQLAILDRCPLTKRGRREDGESLFELGDRDFKFFVVKSGRVEIVDESGDAPQTIGVLGPGEFTGDEAQVTGGPTVVGAVTRGDAEVYEVTNDALRQILNLHPDLGDVFMRAFLARRQQMRDDHSWSGSPPETNLARTWDDGRRQRWSGVLTGCPGVPRGTRYERR